MTWLACTTAAVLIAAVLATLIARRHRARPPHVAAPPPVQTPSRPVTAPRWTGQIGPDLGVPDIERTQPVPAVRLGARRGVRPRIGPMPPSHGDDAAGSAGR